jgi:hypothetical protein
MLANMNSIVFDYVSRQKIQSRHLNAYILEQLPFIDAKSYDNKLGNITVGDFVREQVLQLTYTSWDMQPFAKDLGYDGSPFEWNEEDRRHNKAKLDALFFNLYEINEDNTDYILSTFPIVKQEDEEKYGTYLTRTLIINYMRALKAGDTNFVVNVSMKKS